METIFSMMDNWLKSHSLDATIATALGTRVVDKTVTETTENGWKTKTTKVISNDGYSYTYISKTKLDGTHNEYSEKKDTLTKADLEKMEADAVQKRDYETAAKIKRVIDAMKK